MVAAVDSVSFGGLALHGIPKFVMVFCAVIHILFPPVCILFVAYGASVHGKYVLILCRCDGLQLALAVGTSDVEIVIGVDGGGVLGK